MYAGYRPTRRRSRRGSGPYVAEPCETAAPAAPAAPAAAAADADAAAGGAGRRAPASSPAAGGSSPASTWALVIVAFAAVWKTSRELGLTTWWLGPFGEPQPAFVTMLPFVAPLVMVVLALNNVRRLPWVGLAAAAVARASSASFDLARRPPPRRSSSWPSPPPARCSPSPASPAATAA